jgi:hypothetical protein
MMRSSYLKKTKEKMQFKFSQVKETDFKKKFVLNHCIKYN